MQTRQSVSAAQRSRSFRSCLLCTHHYYTTLHINCGLASEIPAEIVPLPPPLTAESTNHKTKAIIHPLILHCKLHSGPVVGGWGGEV